jgi:hypothetical protein
MIELFLDQAFYCALHEVICANKLMITWFLLDFRDIMREYRDDSERLDQCSHLDDLSPLSFELDAGQITQVGFTTFVVQSVTHILWCN